MHELSIAASIVDLAQEEAAIRNVRILAVRLQLGPLSGVMREALLGSFEMAAAGTPLENARLIIAESPIVVLCPQCQQQRTLPSIESMRCPECGAPAAEVLAGAELLVTGLEVEP
jgi:hydrogenase nickel incorporation protein HypA/HybF